MQKMFAEAMPQSESRGKKQVKQHADGYSKYGTSQARSAHPICVTRPNSDFMLTVKELLPTEFRQVYIPRAENQTTDTDLDVLAFRTELNRRQNPQICNENGDVGVGNFARYGVGACFHLLSRPMTRAWEMGRGFRWLLPFDIQIHDNYQPQSPDSADSSSNSHQKETPFCPNAELTCFVEPVSNCSKFGSRQFHQGFNWFHQDTSDSQSNDKDENG